MCTMFGPPEFVALGSVVVLLSFILNTILWAENETLHDLVKTRNIQLEECKLKRTQQ